MKIRVEDDHILNGEPADCDACPIQLALCEQLGREDIRVQSSYVTIGTFLDSEVIDLPTEATEFISRYDGDFEDSGICGGIDGVNPIEFELPVDHLVVKPAPSTT